MRLIHSEKGEYHFSLPVLMVYERKQEHLFDFVYVQQMQRTRQHYACFLHPVVVRESNDFSLFPSDLRINRHTLEIASLAAMRSGVDHLAPPNISSAHAHTHLLECTRFLCFRKRIY